MNRRARVTVTVLLALMTTSSAFAGDPGPSWRMVADPAGAGWSPEALAAARAQAESIGSAAVMVVESGRVIAAWGDVERRFRSASLRKSLISALYGIAVERKQVKLGASLAELGVDELGCLTADEKKATLRDLLSARSGVYLPAAKVTPSQVSARPPRGSHPAGTFWFYNNWDFNAAGGILARATGTDPGEMFLNEIAKPVGMQDFRASDFYWELEPRISRHAAFDIRISTRDLARVGQLFLNRGTWNGKRVISEAWIDESVRIVTPFGDGSGYGYMWWINPERSSYFGLASDAQSESSMTYAADGAGAQLLFVVPAKGLVIVHRGDTDNGRGVDERAALELAAQIVRARTERPGDAPVALTELVPAPLPNAKPAPAEHKAIAFEPGSIAALVGFYVVSPKMTVELFEHEGRLFAFAPGRGELELFAFAKESYFARSTPLEITVERGSGGEVVAINGSLQGNPIRAVKQAAPTDREASAPSGARSE